MSGPKRSAWGKPFATSTPPNPTTTPSAASTSNVVSGGSSQSASSLSSSSFVAQIGLPTCSSGRVRARRDSSRTVGMSSRLKLRRLLATEDTGRAPGIVESREPGEHDRDEHGPPGHLVRDAAAGGEPAETRGDRLRPGLELAEVARADHDAALERGQSEAGDEELAGDDGGDHPRRQHPVDEHD